MFGIDSSELAVIALVALLVIGPKDLPRVMRMVGQWLAKGRAMTRHVRAGFDTMMREAELEEMQKQWAAQNEAIMKASALPDLGIREALPDLSVPDLSADEWMSPSADSAPHDNGASSSPHHDAADVTPDYIDASTPDITAPAEKPRRRRTKAGETGPNAAAETSPRMRKPRRKAEPQPTEHE